MAERPARLAAPARVRPWPMRIADFRLVIAANAVLVAYLWVRHGGPSAATSPAGALTAIGQLSALLGTYLVLVVLLLVARAPFLERRYGEKSVRYHSLLGRAAIVLISIHVVGNVAAYALLDSNSIVDEFANVVITYPYMLAALVGFGLLVVVGMSSIRPIRSRLSYETWTGIHLYAYLAVLLAFGHELAVGTDFAAHPLARVYWVGLYGCVFALIVVYRVLVPLAFQLRHRFRVERVVVETPDVVSIYVGGHAVDRIPARAGQYFRLRLLVRDEWWRSHPFSLSAVPDGRALRFTVKSLGDFSERLQSLRPGTRVMLDGPYGAMTGARRSSRGVALVGGGIGITPMRALFEEFAGTVDVRLVYRASRHRDVVFADELGQLSRSPDATVAYVIGRRGDELPTEPLSASALQRLIPDIDSRDVFLSGPTPMMAAVERSLHELGVPGHRIHTERFAA